MADFKLYYTPTSCGAANYIVAHLGGLKFESEQVDLSSKKTASGADYRKVNPKGNVPAVVLSDGSLLNENIATLSYLADASPRTAGLAPPPGPARYPYLNALGFVNSELHPAFGCLFDPSLDAASRAAAKSRALEKVALFTGSVLRGNSFALAAGKPSAVDIYAYIVFTWAKYLDIDLSANKDAVAFMNRVAALPGVAAAHKKMNDATAH